MVLMFTNDKYNKINSWSEGDLPITLQEWTQTVDNNLKQGSYKPTEIVDN